MATPEEMDHLHDWCLRGGRPRTVRELARALLSRRIETETGFIPYDIHRSYRERERIIVRLRDEQEQPAEVESVARRAYSRAGVICGDIIKVRLLRQEAVLEGQETREFIGNYNGDEFDGPEIRQGEIVKEKDEDEVIPKLLMVLSNDRRFAEFNGEWLPVDLVMTEVSDKVSEAVTIIGKHKGGIGMRELLEEIHVDGLGEDSRSRAEFSLDYFLKREKTVAQRQSDGEIMWEVRVRRPPAEECSVTVRSEWIERGILVVPLRLAKRMAGAETVRIHYGGLDQEVAYEEQTKTIRGLRSFYKKKALTEGDRVHLRAQDGHMGRLFIYARWKTSLDRLLRIEPQKLDWENAPLRDCIIVVLAKLRMPLHYREIYAEVAHHKRVSSGSVIATLSRHCGSVFVHVEHGKWQLAGLARPKEQNNLHREKVAEIPQPSEDTWKAVENIEGKDYVYKLLREAKRPLSFDEMCSKLGRHLGIDVDELRATGFLRGDDERLRRLDDGTWALAESSEKKFLKTGDEIERADVKVGKDSRTWVWVVVLGLAASAIAGIVYLVMKGR